MKIFNTIISLFLDVFWVWTAYRYIMAPATLNLTILLVVCIISGLYFVYYTMKRMNED